MCSSDLVDFMICFDNGASLLVEIKPYKQTIPPIKPKQDSNKLKRRYQNELATYAVNLAKWDAARHFCSKKGLKFAIITEKEL